MSKTVKYDCGDKPYPGMRIVGSTVPQDQHSLVKVEMTVAMLDRIVEMLCVAGEKDAD